MDKVSLAQVEYHIVAFTDDVLAPAAVYTNTIDSVIGYTHLCGLVYSDQNSATDGLSIEQAASASDFALGYYTRSTYTMVGGDTENNAFSVQLVAPFLRIRYTNGGTLQTVFRLVAGARILRGL